LKQEPAGNAQAWRRHWTVPDRDSYETWEAPAISHMSSRGARLIPLTDLVTAKPKMAPIAIDIDLEPINLRMRRSSERSASSAGATAQPGPPREPSTGRLVVVTLRTDEVSSIRMPGHRLARAPPGRH
jgi:hypothetical protein